MTCYPLLRGPGHFSEPRCRSDHYLFTRGDHLARLYPSLGPLPTSQALDQRGNANSSTRSGRGKSQMAMVPRAFTTSSRFCLSREY